ncbi:MAG: hypothetical protein PHF63_00840 [Herbinix sp.]|nr:hypothetical protein [Herbinix sp.]
MASGIQPDIRTNVAFDTDRSYINKSMQTVKNNIGIYQNQNSKTLSTTVYTKFNRFKYAIADLELSRSFSHVFFTRPDLNILDKSGSKWTLNSNTTNDPFFNYVHRTSNVVLPSLTSSFSGSHDFIPMLSNTIKSFEVSDEYIDTNDYGETFTGYKMKYGRNDIKSKTAGNFSISYRDDKDLNVYKLHKAWVDYISKVYRGEFTPDRLYIENRILDYAVGCYYIITGEDGETVLFWSKYYGVFPTSTSSNIHSWSANNLNKNQDLNISYDYSFKDDLNPLAIAEFNINAKVSNGSASYYKTFDRTNKVAGEGLVGAPFIETVRSGNEYIFKLRFKK